MPTSKKQLIRLVRLVAQLKENRYPNCTSFAKEMQKADLNENLNLACSPRTVYRDIQILKTEFGAPIKFDVGRNGYFLSHHGWTFSCPCIEDDEMLAAVLGARIAEHVFPSPMKDRIRKAVDHLLTENNPDFLDDTQVNSLMIIPSNRAEVDAKVFVPLFRAWQDHEICRITYRSSQRDLTEREFEPHALVFFDGMWYAKGFCHMKQAMRTLALPRMKSVNPTGVSFLPDSKIIQTVTEEQIFNPEMIENVVVRCDSYLSSLVLTHPLHPNQMITPLQDGGCELRIKSMSKYRLITWTMHQCGRAEIVSPNSLRKHILDIAKAVTKKHSQKSQ
jgi:predicted DNA-binding transcriptional regulator YafY